MECFECHKDISNSVRIWPAYTPFEDYFCNECYIVEVNNGK